MIDKSAFPHKRDGNPTKRSAERIELIWDRLGPLIANPTDRPFKVHRPRGTAREKTTKLRQRAKRYNLDLTGLRGVKGFPISYIKGSPPSGFDFRNPDRVIHRYPPGRRRLTQTFFPFDLEALVRDPQGYSERFATQFEDADAVRIRTGPGFWSPAENGMGLAQGIAYLTEAYDDSDDWLSGLEVFDLEE